MPGFLYRSRIIIALASAILLFCSKCSKSVIEPVSPDLVAQYFETNILNKDFVVHLATDNGADLTAQYNGYVFKLYKNTMTDGPMTAISGSTTYNGTWSTNADYSKLVITLPATPTIFEFLNREWKFTKKAVPIMELAPWGTLEPKVLHMQRL